MGNWYRLFPRNPYARIAGLVPLVILVGVLVLSGLERYIYGYQYDPGTVSNFTQDLSLIPPDTKQLVVSEAERPFYNVVAVKNKDYTVVAAPTEDTFVASRAGKTVYPGYAIDSIVTDRRVTDSDRFYVYKKITP